MATVEMDSLCKVFPGGVEAVRNAKIVVEDKEFVVLLGPSGCGKTTLLRLIAGLETITQGELKIDGRVVNDVKPKDRDIAMVFQSYALYPHMSVFDNMSLALKLKKLPREEIEQRVGDAARILGIADLMSRKPGQLSGGQRQRVAVGRAIVRKPKVFLFDEPLSNLDAKKRVQMRFEISQLHQRLNATIIYVTHDQTEAMTMGNRIVVMKDGTIQQVGKPLEVYRQPANRFVAEFIGSPSMNFARVKRSAPAESFLTSNAGVRIELRNGSLSSVADVEVDVGIRPEHLEVESTVSNAHDLHLSGEIAFLEPLGSETHVHVRIGKETNWVAALRGDKVLEVGQTVELFARSEHVHLFDPENGEPLAAPV